MADAVSARDLARTAAEEVTRLGSELEEIELLAQQAQGEATRHEAKRAQLQERLNQLTSGRPAPPEEIREATNALASATRRASLMEAQVDVLRGKQRVLERFRDRLRFYAEALAGTEDLEPGSAHGDADHQADGGLSGRAIRDAQEDLRRDIARAMHDGPAQSLTNIALQAQIVQRLVARDTERAVVEVGAARGHGPADPGGDQDLHLRRAPDGPRRPGHRADPAADGPRSRADGAHPGRVRLRRRRPPPRPGPRERHLPHRRRRHRRLS